MAINPRVTFERMFGETGIGEESGSANLKQKQSMLDSIAAGNGGDAAEAGPGRQRDSR